MTDNYNIVINGYYIKNKKEDLKERIRVPPVKEELDKALTEIKTKEHYVCDEMNGYADLGFMKIYFNLLEDWLLFYTTLSSESEDKQEKILAVMALTGLNHVEDIYEAMDKLNDYIFVKGIDDLASLGDYVLKNTIGTKQYENLNYYVDKELLGKDYIQFDTKESVFINGNFIALENEKAAIEEVEEMEQ